MKGILIFGGLLIGLIVGFCTGYDLHNDECSDKMQLLHIENAFLKDYKSAYKKHLEACNTASFKVSDTYTMSDAIGNSTVCCHYCNSKITK